MEGTRSEERNGIHTYPSHCVVHVIKKHWLEKKQFEPHPLEGNGEGIVWELTFYKLETFIHCMLAMLVVTQMRDIQNVNQNVVSVAKPKTFLNIQRIHFVTCRYVISLAGNSWVCVVLSVRVPFTECQKRNWGKTN